MNKNSSIKIANLTKTYKLYDKHIDRLKESLNPLRKKYHREFNAVKDISFEIKKGETVGIIGTNGSGKSTLLKMITGVITPTAGRVNVHGKISAILELGAGFNPEMSGVENIYLNTSINGLTKEDTDKIIDDIIAFSELNEFIYQPLKTYSSGMKARLAFAVSINIHPDILIVDEALSVGDVAFARKCFAKIEEIRKAGATILFVSHSEGAIVSLCNRAIWINKGEMVIDGAPKLVTGLYLKNINKQQIDIKKIELEYQKLNEQINTEKIVHNTQSSTEFFNPHLQPKSTIYYENKGASISDVKVTTLANEKVNILTYGNEYYFQYKVEFQEEIKEAQFGFLIKKRDGSILGGGALPDKKNFYRVDNKNIHVKIKFKCTLNLGEYFFNTGVLVKDKNQIFYGHRILDAYLIKVINSHEFITGSINFIKDFSIEDINE